MLTFCAELSVSIVAAVVVPYALFAVIGLFDAARHRRRWREVERRYFGEVSSC